MCSSAQTGHSGRPPGRLGAHLPLLLAQLIQLSILGLNFLNHLTQPAPQHNATQRNATQRRTRRESTSSCCWLGACKGPERGKQAGRTQLHQSRPCLQAASRQHPPPCLFRRWLRERTVASLCNAAAHIAFCRSAAAACRSAHSSSSWHTSARLAWTLSGPRSAGQDRPGAAGSGYSSFAERSRACMQHLLPAVQPATARLCLWWAACMPRA